MLCVDRLSCFLLDVGLSKESVIVSVHLVCHEQEVAELNLPASDSSFARL